MADSQNISSVKGELAAHTVAGEEKAQRTVSLGWKWVWLRMVLENKAEETIPQPRHGVTAQK